MRACCRASLNAAADEIAQLELAESIVASEAFLWLMSGGDPKWRDAHLSSLQPAYSKWIEISGGYARYNGLHRRLRARAATPEPTPEPIRAQPDPSWVPENITTGGSTSRPEPVRDLAAKVAAPFQTIPSGIEIARYFWHETERRNNGCDGIRLFRDGSDYCYLWVKAIVDHDLWHSYLLDIRTHVDGVETRDFLFLHAGADGAFDVEWHNQPIRFDAATEAHRERFATGMQWLARCSEKAIEDADSRALLSEEAQR